MVSKDTQDNLEIFQGALEKGLLDWKTFFHLEQDQRADAEQILSEQGYLSWTPGSYEVSPGIRGIVPASRAPACFKDEAAANTLVEFYKSKGQQVSVKKID